MANFFLCVYSFFKKIARFLMRRRGFQTSRLNELVNRTMYGNAISLLLLLLLLLFQRDVL